MAEIVALQIGTADVGPHIGSIKDRFQATEHLELWTDRVPSISQVSLNCGLDY